MSEFPALGHVALTVTDLRASAQWYGRLLDTQPVLDEHAGGYDHIVFALAGRDAAGPARPSRKPRARSVRRTAGRARPRRLPVQAYRWFIAYGARHGTGWLN